MNCKETDLTVVPDSMVVVIQHALLLYSPLPTVFLITMATTGWCIETVEKVSKGAKIRNRYNQVPHLTQDTNGKVTNSQ